MRDSSRDQGVAEIAAAITATQEVSSTRFVAIDGLGGSGKSTLVNSLVALEPSFKVLKLDEFPCTPEKHALHPLGCQTRVDLERFVREALLPLRDGREARFATTSWWPLSESGSETRIQPGGNVLVEGCYALHRSIRAYYNLAIWIQVAPEAAVERAIRRDGESGRQAWEQAHHTNEVRYLATHRPDEAADLIVENAEEEGFRLRER